MNDHNYCFCCSNGKYLFIHSSLLNMFNVDFSCINCIPNVDVLSSNKIYFLWISNHSDITIERLNKVSSDCVSKVKIFVITPTIFEDALGEWLFNNSNDDEMSLIGDILIDTMRFSPILIDETNPYGITFEDAAI